MKKLLLFVLFACIRQMDAQINFPMSGADWHYQVENFSFFGPSTYSNIEVKYTHDTLFMGKTVKVLDNVLYYNYCSPSSGSTFLYSSNDSVFFYNSETLNQWQLLYSFGTPIGQSWQFRLENSTNGVDTVNVKVDSVKNTLINSISLKTLFVTYTEKNPSILPYHSVIYDRIGDITYLFNFVPNIYGLCDGGQKFEGVLCYSDSTFAVYQPDTAKSCNYIYVGIQSINNSNSFKMYPNPTSDQLFIDANTTDKLNVDLFDVNGRHVFSASVMDKTNINVATLNEGVYSLIIKTADRVTNKKLVIVR